MAEFLPGRDSNFNGKTVKVMGPVYVALGGNLSGTGSAFDKTRSWLEEEFGSLRSSSTLETEPWKVQTDKTFLNQVVELEEVPLEPRQFLAQLQCLEDNFGRERSRTPDRILDLDLLYFNHEVQRDEFLRLPHPRLHRRPFVLKPMVELNPCFVHPVLKRTQRELLDNLLEENNSGK